MDITCGRCGEQWDNDTIHEEVAERAYTGEETTYSAVAAEFRQQGCGIAFREFLGNPGQCTKVNSLRAAAADAMADLLGDDMDGAASLMDDFEMAGFFR